MTELLVAVGRGEPGSNERLWSAIYDELHRLAEYHMSDEAAGRTLQATALIHEAYLRLFGGDHTSFANRREFFASAANVMRRILIDDARRRKRVKRGREFTRRPIEQLGATFDEDPARLLALDETLKKLAEKQPRRARVVEMRFFSGMTFEEIAGTLGISRRMAQIDWEHARAWLHRELAKEGIVGS